MDDAEPNRPSYTLWQLALYALKLGSIGFGGPVALLGYMYRDLVERRRWISEADYKEGLTLAQLMPGPLAAQLAMYLGYVHYGVRGASIVGVAFVLPSFWMVVACRRLTSVTSLDKPVTPTICPTASTIGVSHVS